jgi:L-amino acid N-acyltransferase YncA
VERVVPNAFFQGQIAVSVLRSTRSTIQRAAARWKNRICLPVSDRLAGTFPAWVAGMNLTFATMAAGDWPEVQRIYAEGIATGLATFESAPPATWSEFIRTKVVECGLVARDGSDALVGWAALIPVSYRAVYRGVGEASVYVAAKSRGRGVGHALLAELVRGSEAKGFWTLQSSTFPQNHASLAVQKRHGFHIVGIREKIGRMPHGPLAGQWCDTLLLERRSAAVGRA